LRVFGGHWKRQSRRKRKKYSKIFIYIPQKVALDTRFPFKKGEDVTVRIEGKKLIIEKWENTKKKEHNSEGS
jgi:ABC-type Mn2+/Zn2+ transport system ATPase subunit